MNILTILGYVLVLIIAVYLLMILLAWYIGHPTPVRWYRPDMHPDDTGPPTAEQLIEHRKHIRYVFTGPQYLPNYDLWVSPGQWLVLDETQNLICVKDTHTEALQALQNYYKYNP